MRKVKTTKLTAEPVVGTQLKILCTIIYFLSSSDPSLLVPETFFHGAWPPDSLWPSGSGRVRSRQQASPGSGPRRQGSWVWLWVLNNMEVETEGVGR